MTKQIPLTLGKFALIDDVDFEWINQWTWAYNRTGYAIRIFRENGKPFVVFMHRLIMGTTDKLVHVDHINHVRVDNRKHNLRISTHQQNSMNRSPYPGKTSKYKGVCKRPFNKWGAAIKFNGHTYHLGHFSSQEEAAIAYNKKALEFFGEFAYLNIIE